MNAIASENTEVEPTESDYPDVVECPHCDSTVKADLETFKRSDGKPMSARYHCGFCDGWHERDWNQVRL